MELLAAGRPPQSSGEVGSDMFADDVADLRSPLGRKSGKGDDAVVRARRVHDQGRHAEHLFERSASDVDVLDADQRNDRVDVEQPAADDLKQPIGQPVSEAPVDPLRRGEDRHCCQGSGIRDGREARQSAVS